jgi:DedD protein
MAGAFDDEEIEQVAPRHDTELTLGTTALLLIFFGLLALCGLCFGMGYSMGRHGSPETSAASPSTANENAAAHSDSSHSKPSANPEASAATRSSQPANQPRPSSSNTSMQSSAAAGDGSSAKSVESAQPVSIRPAIGNAANPVQAEVPSSTVRPALSAETSLMVQIAAVSQSEDADVLTSALRKRGYAVAAHREPLDGLIHVRIGPFKTREEADAWRQKLLNDGYNAIVQP